MTHDTVSGNDLSLFARTDYRGEGRLFGIKQRDRLAHMYILGKTGTGKSTLLQHLMVSDLEAGRGFALIDPHGDLVEDMLDLVPPTRVADVIYFNPADQAHPIGFNPLDPRSGGRPELVVSGVLDVFKKTWPEFWGPRMEYVLRNALLTLTEVPDATLLDVRRLLVDPAFLAHAEGYLQDPALRSFWAEEFRRYPAHFKQEVIAPILNKVGRIVMSPMLRSIFGQPRSALILREVIDEGRILLVNVAKGRIGEGATTLLGSLLSTLIEVAALGRADRPPESRRPFYLYIDEFHVVATPAFVSLLPEARKFAAGIVAVHQFLAQNDEPLQAALLGTVGTMVVFRVGAQDAKLLAEELHPPFDRTDLVHLPGYHAYVRLMIDGTVSRPFSAISLPPPTKRYGLGTTIVAESRARYGRAWEPGEPGMGPWQTLPSVRAPPRLPLEWHEEPLPEWRGSYVSSATRSWPRRQGPRRPRLGRPTAQGPRHTST
jgi:hypothetical protein